MGLWGLALVGGTTFSSAIGALQGVRPAQRICAFALLVVGTTQVVNSVRRLLEGHREIEHMGRKLFVELIVLAVVPLSVGACVLAHAPSIPLLVMFAVVLFASLMVAAPLEREIARLLAENGKRSITAWVRSLRWPVRWFYGDPDRTLGDALDEAGGFVETVGSALLDVQPGTIGIVRAAMVATLAAATLGFVQAPLRALAGANASRSITTEDVGEGRRGTPSRQGPRQAAPSPNASTTPTVALPSAIAEQWDRACLAEPGAGAPASAPWLGRDVHDLYLGSSGTSRVPAGNDAPGAAAGCTGRIERVQGSSDSYFAIATYQRTGEIGSVAVDSLRDGPALFIAPAALPVLALLHRYKTLGGTPRHRVGRGDFYLIRIDIGSVVLVRAQYQQKGRPGLVEGYVQLDPPVAEAWLECMHEHHGWLWPIVRRSLPHDRRDVAYDFVDAIVAPRYRVTVYYSPTRQIAYRPTATQTRYYMPSGFQLSEGELMGLAATAR